MHTMFRAGRPALRIVTPQTLQRTAFEEHRRADTGTVMNGVSLDIEDNASGLFNCRHVAPPLARAQQLFYTCTRHELYNISHHPANS
jgi:hypothetical protein